MREYLGFTRITYVIVELRPFPVEFRGRVPKAFTKMGYTCKAIKARPIRVHLKKSLCVGLMYEIEFKKFVSLLLNRNPTCYAKVQVVDTFTYAQSLKCLALLLKHVFKFKWRNVGILCQYSNIGR